MPYKQSLAYSKNLIKGTKIEVLKKKRIMPFTGETPDSKPRLIPHLIFWLRASLSACATASRL